MTQPDPATQTPPAATTEGQTTDTSGTTEGQAPPKDEAGKPLFVANTQDDLNAKFGATRAEGRLSIAKSFGFDTVEAFETATTQWKKTHDSQLTDAQKAKQAEDALKAENKTLKRSLAESRLTDEAKRIAGELGIDAAKLPRVMEYRTKSEEEIGADGNVNPALLEHSLATFIGRNPEFKAAPTTVGVTGSNPATGATDKITLDEQIRIAQEKNNFTEVIRLQTMKMFTPE